MMLLATIFPSLFEGLGVSLSISLTVGIIVSFFVNSSQLDWIFVILFALYVGYDWTMAQEDEPKLSNAIMHAANLYLDIVNLFTRMLDD
jgi:FtsH-binding integral membrane protein